MGMVCYVDSQERGLTNGPISPGADASLSILFPVIVSVFVGLIIDASYINTIYISYLSMSLDDEFAIV